MPTEQILLNSVYYDEDGNKVYKKINKKYKNIYSEEEYEESEEKQHV